VDEVRNSILSRRSLLLALASTPFLGIAAMPQVRKRLAILSTIAEKEARTENEAVLKALAARGYVQGRQLDVLLSYHVRKGGLEGRIRELVAWRPDVILTRGTVSTEWLLRLGTKTIPVVTYLSDPVGAGFAASLRRPGGNVTGLSLGAPEVATKTMEVLKILLPRVKRVAIVSIDDPPGRLIAGFPERAARAAGLDAVTVPAQEGEDLPNLFRALASRGFHAAYWGFMPNSDETVAAREAIRAGIPLVGGSEQIAVMGALASLNADIRDFDERAADIIVKIFDGVSPAEIPIEFPQRFRFVLNARTARALGIRISPDLLLRADRVIE
jgi:putative ABC transport system substrate-binding protein